VAANYADDARLAKLLATATAIALVIAAFGTYTLAAHTVQRRAREIALRKLYWATPRDVGRLMARETGLLAVMAALGALPVAALLIHLHLTGYVEQAAPSPYLALLIAPAATLLVIAIAVARHVMGSMRLRPAAVLRS
jgi:putative ABC transport system permease protein